MSQRGIRTGPIDPGFCPSDALDANDQITKAAAERFRLEAEVAALRVELAKLARDV